MAENVLYKRLLKIYAEGYRPSGSYDKGKRWYPSDEERCDCCDYVRSPSRAFPYSYLKHCSSQKHIKNRLREHFEVEGDKDLPKLINEQGRLGVIARNLMLGQIK